MSSRAPSKGYDTWSSLSYFDARRWFEPEAETVRLIADDSTGESKLDLEEVLYALNAFWATLKPVAISLLLARCPSNTWNNLIGIIIIDVFQLASSLCT